MNFKRAAGSGWLVTFDMISSDFTAINEKFGILEKLLLTQSLKCPHYYKNVSYYVRYGPR